MTNPAYSEILDTIEKKAVEAQIANDACAWSTMYGLSTYFSFIPDEMVTASWSLIGGTGIGSGSCGAYCSGLLALGLKYNPSLEEAGTEAGNKKVEKGMEKMLSFRDAFLKEYGSILCPEIHKVIFGRSFNFLDEKQQEEFLSIPDHAEKCADVVAKATRIAAEMLLEDN